MIGSGISDCAGITDNVWRIPSHGSVICFLPFHDALTGCVRQFGSHEFLPAPPLLLVVVRVWKLDVDRRYPIDFISFADPLFADTAPTGELGGEGARHRLILFVSGCLDLMY